MIDKLVMFCEFRDIDAFNLRNLCIPLEGSIDASGRLSWVRHPWEKIPSSFDSVAFKVHDYSLSDQPRAYVELKASPAKVMQGHNVFGSDDLSACAWSLIEAFGKAYPQVIDALDLSTWDIREIDITYHSRAESVKAAKMFIQACANISKGQTKARHGYASTTYFGKKNSRLKKLKLYEKSTEIEAYLNKKRNDSDAELEKEIFTDELIDYSRGLIRWESTIKARWLERNGFPTNLFELVKVFDPRYLWEKSTRDVRESIEGHDMKLNTDDKIESRLKERYSSITNHGRVSYTKATNCFRTYRLIKNCGFIEAKRLCSSSAFYRHLEMLDSIGVSRASLQNNEHGAVVVPLVRYVEVNFGEQVPEWAKVVA